MDRAFIVGLLRDWGLALLAAVLIFVGWGWLFGGGLVTSGEAPDFTLPDVMSDESLTLSELGDGPIIVNFWATWCGPCKAEIPDLIAYSKAHPDVPLVGVSVDEGMPSGRLRRWVEARNMTYNVVHDRAGTVSEAWGVDTLPTTFVLSDDNHITSTKVGMVDEDGLRRMVDAAKAHEH